MNRRDFLGATAAATLSLSSPALLAQKAYPNKQIRFVVPFAAGGGGDILSDSFPCRRP
jgi:tripartite-type tricarboxylate transporter receptor subunit TctC